MKRNVFLLAIFLLLSSFLCAEEALPAYSGFVNDYAGILDAQNAAKLSGLAKELEQKTSAEMAIAIVKTTAPMVPKEYAVKLFQKWKIGKKEKDNGILILLAMEERRVEIEVGYGLEGAINDAKAGQILDTYVIPFFKKGDFPGGLYNGAEALAAEIAKDAKADLGTGYKGYKSTAGSSSSSDGMIINILTFAIIAFVVIMAVAPPWISGIVGGVIGGCVGILSGGMGAALFGGIIGFGASALFAWVMIYLAKNYKGGSGGTSSGGGWFSGGGGSSSGGGFSFGGGGSGGGGAGRSW